MSLHGLPPGVIHTAVTGPRRLLPTRGGLTREQLEAAHHAADQEVFALFKAVGVAVLFVLTVLFCTAFAVKSCQSNPQGTSHEQRP